MPIITPEYNLYNWSDLNFPTIEPSLKLDFANARALDPRITFTRASTATYVGSNGLIKTAGEDEARFDHDPATGESLGLLIEESRTNFITYSEDVSNAAWSKNNSNVQSNSIVSPSGDTTADKVFDDSTVGATHSISQSFGKAAILYTGSVYAKAGEYTKVALGFVGVSNWEGIPQALFDLSTGQVTSVGNGGPTANITAVGNGWYRCSLTAESLNTTSSGLSIGIISDSGTNVGGGGIFLGHDGDGSSGLYVWGLQVEAGTFPTSYIPTAGATVTRTVEYGYTTNMDFYNQSGGSVLSEVSLLDVGNTGGKVIWSLNQAGGFGEGIYMVNENNGQTLSFNLIDGGTNQNARATTNITANQYYKTIHSFETNNVNMGYGGAIGTDDTSATLPTIGRLVIGNNAWGSSTPSNTLNPGNCHIKSFSYYPKRLPNTQLQTLTQ